MADEVTRPQVVEYKPGVKREQYIDSFRQGAETILASGVEDPRLAVLDYAEQHLSSLFDQIQAGDVRGSEATVAIRRQRGWKYGAIAIGILAAALAAYGGAQYNDSQLRPQYNAAVTAASKATEEKDKFASRVKTLEGVVSEQIEDIGKKDKMIGEWEELLEKYFGKPPEKAKETK